MIEFQGILLKNPVVASPSPATESIDNIQRCADKGVGAIILKSIGPQTIAKKSKLIPRRMVFRDSTLYMLSSLQREIMSVDQGLRLLRESKKNVPVPIIASVCGQCEEFDAWKNACDAMATAGADMIQLDLLYSVGLADNAEGKSLNEIVSLAEEVRDSTGKPVMIKLSAKIPIDTVIRDLRGKDVAVSLLDSIQVGIPANVASEKTTFSEFYGVARHGRCLAAGKILYPLSLLYTQELSRNGIGPICAGGGVFRGQDAMGLLLSGASLIQIATAICIYGFDVISAIVSQLDEALKQENVFLHISKGDLFRRTIGYRETETIKGVVERAAFEECKDCEERACEKTVMCGSKERVCEGCGLCIDVCPKKVAYFREL